MSMIIVAILQEDVSTVHKFRKSKIQMHLLDPQIPPGPLDRYPLMEILFSTESIVR